MKCKVCEKTTTWDTSVGYDSYIVCNDCVARIAKEQHKTRIKVLEEILNKGFRMENQKKI